MTEPLDCLTETPIFMTEYLPMLTEPHLGMTETHSLTEPQERYFFCQKSSNLS